MIKIRPSPTADTRTCDFSKVTKETLYTSSLQHITDVRKGMDFFKDLLDRAARKHDHDKISGIDQFHADFVTGFKQTGWWDNHRKVNRHHLAAADGVPDDVNLVDVLDFIVDCVMAGMARSGSVYKLELTPGLLELAFQNTVELLKKNVEVEKAGLIPISFDITKEPPPKEQEICKRCGKPFLAIEDHEACYDGRVTTNGMPPCPGYENAPAPAPIDPKTGQHIAYWVLSEEERKKGWVRPLRRSYRHVGKRPTFPLRTLTPEETERYSKYGYVFFEESPEGTPEEKRVARFWTQAELDKKPCGTKTTMGLALCETYAKNPKFYGATFCVGCGDHLPVNEFVWDEDGTEVGS